MLTSKLAAIWRRLDFDVEIPPVLFRPISRFSFGALAGAFIGWLIGGPPLVFGMGLCYGLIMASPIFGPELLRRAQCINPSRRRKRALACTGAVALLEILIVVAVSILLGQPLLISLMLIGAITILFLCISGFINLVVEVVRIGIRLRKLAT